MLLTSVAMLVASALAAVVLQRPYLVELGLPFLVVLVVGLLLDGPAEVEVTVELTSERILEDDVTEILVTLRGHGPGGRVVIDLPGARRGHLREEDAGRARGRACRPRGSWSSATGSSSRRGGSTAGNR